MINPNLRKLYEWDYQDQQSNVVFILHHPENFNPDCLNIQITEDAISVFISDEDVPIIAGTLQGPVKKHLFDHNLQEKITTITLTKGLFDNWDFPISDSHPTLEVIDPKSTFELYNRLLGSSPSDEIAPLLSTAVEAGYVPAVLFVYESLPDSDKEQSRQLLEIAADTYHEPEAMLHLGILLSRFTDQRGKAYARFQDAADAGIAMGYTYMGKMLSPASDFDYEHKNPETAVTFFQKAIELDPNEFLAQYELAVLLKNGIGCKKDERQAALLLKRARDLCASGKNEGLIPNELPTFDEGLGLWTKVGIGAASLAAIGGIGFLIFRMIRK